MFLCDAMSLPMSGQQKFYVTSTYKFKHKFFRKKLSEWNMRYVFIIFLFCGNQLCGQVLNLPANPANFIEEYSKQTEKQLGASVQQVNGRFVPFFQNNLSESAKSELVSTISFLSKKGLSPSEIVRFSEVLMVYADSPGADVSQFLSFLQKDFQAQSAKKITPIINQLDLFYKKGELYSSDFNKVKLNNNGAKLKFLDKPQAYFAEEGTAYGTNQEFVDWGMGEDDGWDTETRVSSVSQNQTVLPKVQGLFFEFGQSDVVLTSPSDSFNIQGVNAAYNFSDGILLGQGGKLFWEVSGKVVSAALDKFSFKPDNGKLLCENAKVEHPELLKEPIAGVLELKMEKRAGNEPSTYPRFKSYKNNASYILNLEDYEFLAGYQVIGNVVSSSSINDKYAKLWVNKESKTKQFEAVGTKFIINDSLITSDRVSFVARFGVDSVSHPAIRFEYNIPKAQIQLNKVHKGGFRQAMFSDTFHQVDIRCDAMSWDLNSGKMDFYIVAGKGHVAAEFESFDSFFSNRLSTLSSQTGFNALMAAANVVGKKKKNAFGAEEIMKVSGKERYMVRNGLLIGNQMGFFDYHPFEDYYSISRKGLHYYFVATGKKDYDDLVFSSLNTQEGQSKNATIDFETKSLDIMGAQNFKLSDSLGIKLLPDNQSMQVIGNKVFSFNGKIVVKNFTFYGDFVLEYEKFLVNLNRIDSITFIPLEIYKRGGKLELAANFRFGKTGKLYLNSPDNKSGRKKHPEYPKLEIPDGVKVYFNEKGRIEKFSEAVEFFAESLSLDSLNTINPSIAGVFSTGSIFKPINDNLVVMPDSTMGMQHKAAGNYKLYGSGASIRPSGEIVLNKNGIFSSGEIKHLSAILNVEKVKFFEDYAVANGLSGSIAEKQTEKAYFPNVNISDFDMFWSPAADSMSVASTKGFEFYNASTVLSGGLVLRKAGLFGKGDLARKDSDISSSNFKFDKNGFLADDASIKVKADEQLAFSGKNVNIDFDVTDNLVQISPINSGFDNHETAFLEFPSSQYKTTIDKAVWNIKDKQISMEGALENSLFTSTASNQYGLKFKGTGAKYDIAAKKLSMSGVEEINAADAAIKPPKGIVLVKEDGKLGSFENAIIVADTLNRYHTLTNANVTINSKLSYSGNADYRYVNVSLDTFNIKLGGFEFAEINANGQILNSKGSGKLSTIAKASVSEKDHVFLAKKMLYKGDLTMLAPFKNLSLKGQVLPDLKRYPMIGGSWIDYEGSKSENVSINIDETLRDGGKPLYVGLHMKYGADTDGIYPSFLSMKGSSDDQDIFVARGTFGRDESQKKFYVVPTEELGNGADFYDDDGVLELFGSFNLLGVPTKIFETVGKASVDMDSLKYRFETMMLFDFPMPIPTVQKFGQNLVKANLDAGNTTAAVEPASDDFIRKLSQVVGAENAQKYRDASQKGHDPLFKQSTKFLKSLVISKLNLLWNPTANAYHSVGKIGISNMGDVDINAQVDGYVEIVQSHSTGSELNIYLDISPNKWYYLLYRNGKLGVVSSDEEVNRMLNVSDGKEKEKGVTFLDVNDASSFKKRFLMNYKGMTEEDFKKAEKQPAKKKETKESDGF